jgi:hypothetical protein
MIRNLLSSTVSLVLAAMILFPVPGTAAADTGPDNRPVYRIPLRVHLGGSARPPGEWRPILEEINAIWLSQAGICFEMHTVAHDEPIASGLDLWFRAMIPDWNGYYLGRNDMYVRDDPLLRPAAQPARSSAARTAAHELGHALDLRHRQDSDDNLMRSKTYGWQLHPDEISTARESARLIALGGEKDFCTIRIHKNL